MKRTITVTVDLEYDSTFHDGDPAVEAFLTDVRGMSEHSVNDPKTLTYRVSSLKRDACSVEDFVAEFWKFERSVNRDAVNSRTSILSVQSAILTYVLHFLKDKFGMSK